MVTIVVDDDPIACALVEAHLETLGRKNIFIAADGAEAGTLLQRYGPNVELMLVDLFMPRCDGIELFDIIHAHSPTASVVIISGAQDWVAEPALVYARARGLNLLGRIKKPVTLDKLAPLIAAEPVAS